jgi:dihydrofolate reductase
MDGLQNLKSGIMPTGAGIKKKSNFLNVITMKSAGDRRKMVMYIAMSLDGYIAKPDDDLSFLDSVQLDGEDYGYGEFISSVDTVLIGRKTYDWVVNAIGKNPHEDKLSYVITSQSRVSEGNLQYYSADLNDLCEKLKSFPGKNIYCDGGAQLVNALLGLKQIDEIIISIIPVLLGDGVRLFQKGYTELPLSLIGTKHFKSGLVQLRYSCS